MAVLPAAQKLVVLDLVAKEPFRQGMADMLTDRVSTDLKSLGKYEIFSRAEVQPILEQSVQDPKCETERCQEEVGNALGANMVMSGSVGLVDNQHTVLLNLRNIGTGQKPTRRTWKCDCPAVELQGNIVNYARELLGLKTEAQEESPWAVERRMKEEADRAAREAREAAERAERERRAAEEAARKVEELLRSLGLQMVRIPGGEFEMGSNEHNDEKPVHKVRVADFYLGKTEVTQAQWMKLVGNNPSKFSGCDECPVEQVSWEDAQGFIQKLNQQTGRSFRLPTEAEWEYAAGGGSTHQKWAGADSESSLGDYGWYEGNSRGTTHPVGQKRPNGFGLYDMSGNVWEWCSDWYGNYPPEPQDNPTGPSSGTGRVDRGGSWDGDSWSARVSYRFGLGPSHRGGSRGFRLALPAGQ